MKSQQSGFTLVEIAIVLVIIGLLLGGILKGQELINSAKVKYLANDFRTIPTYIYAYQDKFKSLPGDDNNVAGHLGGTSTQATTGRQHRQRRDRGQLVVRHQHRRVVPVLAARAPVEPRARPDGRGRPELLAHQRHGRRHRHEQRLGRPPRRSPA